MKRLKDTSAAFVLLLWTLVLYHDLCGCEGAALSPALLRDLKGRCPIADPQIRENAVPKGGRNAGNFSVIANATDMSACVRACCSNTKCHMALLHDSSCLNVECKTEDMCVPVPANGSSVVVVRATSVDAEWIAAPLDSKTHMDSSRPGDGDTPNIKELTMPTKSPTARDKRCEVGLRMCQKNEECVPFGEKRRDGSCQCVSGYHLNEKTDECVREASLADTKSTTTTVAPSAEAGTKANASVSAAGSPSSSPPDKGAANTSSNTPSAIASTPSPGSLSPKPMEKLVVSINNKTVYLPAGSTVYDKRVTLSAYAIGDTENKYEWTLLKQPDSEGSDPGSVSDTNSQTITLSHLIQGVYIFKVVVEAPGAYGQAVGNVTVLPAKRINQPPTAIINSPSNTIKLPNSGVIIDGSGSTDDAGIVSYRWEMVTAPLGYKLAEETGPTVQLTDLIPGNYTIMLRVKDEEGLEGNATAVLSVIKETDYPPTANAGGDQIIYLPQTEITLYGNASSDDHGIEGWEWTKGPKDSGKAVDMQDTRTPFLHLSNLEEGFYQFILRVQDSMGQQSNASVNVYVQKPNLSSPKANAGSDIQLVLPNTTVVLDGSHSIDTSQSTHYLWKQKNGPNTAHFDSKDSKKVTVSGLTKGKYEFLLTTWNGEDPLKNTTDTVMVDVIQDQNMPPKANAGGDFSVTLPVSVVMVDGSKSSDDVAVTKWLWEKEAMSLAAAKVINSSDHSPVLMFTDVVAGVYIWKLTVWDDQGASSTDTVSIIVKSSPHELDEVEVVVGGDIGALSYSQLSTLLQKLELFLHTGDRVVSIKLISLTGLPHSGQVRLTVLAYAGKDVVKGTDVVYSLRHQVLSESPDLLDLPLLSVDTVVCQNDCSDHGECIQATRECRCHTWWMESFLRRHMGDGMQNCDWSVVYVFVTMCSVVLIVGLMVWGIATLLMRKFGQNARPRRKPPRYTLLDGHDEGSKLKSSRVHGGLLDSGSESDSDAEVLFDSRKAKHKMDKARNGYHKFGRVRT
ncbi:dyslexia-associated protein KIAA0319-like protein isoform X2 [Penaeus chinensis]|uniref:dyslexia-associated protein KIAA0319-like protein isoform X2 n=1 Tax=Penaeus chinensis TaxID=139456 RepID=UPI001FB7EEFF|nr:dyslexia-associated protein KIAA0319-like protein isoform X2 [Penaeus chinensis]